MARRSYFRLTRNSAYPDEHAWQSLEPRRYWSVQARRRTECEETLLHRRDLMQTRNFNLVFPLMDWLHGTLHWEPAGNPDR